MQKSGKKMDFQDNDQITTVIDPVHFFQTEPPGELSFQAPFHGTLQSVRCEIAEYGHTTGGEGFFDHPYPFFSRIFVFADGRAEVKSNSGTEILRPGNLYFFPSGMPFSIHYHTRDLYYFHLRIHDRNGRSLFQKDDPLIRNGSPDLFRFFLRACGIPDGIVEREAALMQFLAEIFRSMRDLLSERAGAAAEFAEIFRCLETTPPASVTIGGLAERYGIEPGTLSKRFRRKMRIPLKTFLIEQQLHRACELLLYSRKKNHEIARELGFRDVAYFYRFFRAQTGLTPNEFRRRSNPENGSSGRRTQN